MKTRSGFVSNSSSSSFLVAFAHPVKDEMAMRKLLWPKERVIAVYEYSIRCCEAAKIVFKDYKKNKRITNLDDLKEYISGGTLMTTFGRKQPKYPQYHWKSELKNQAAWNNYEKELEKLVDEVAEEFWEKYQNHELICFSYSDNGEGISGTCLEHGNTFKNVPCIVVSEH